MPTTVEQASPWLQGRSLASWQEQFDRSGYLLFERVLPAERVAAIRSVLAPYLERDLKGRNDFEGIRTNRVYALLAKSPLFAELAIHPLALAFAEDELGESCLLSAMLAINLHPGETVQPWHFDDGSVKVQRPRPRQHRSHSGKPSVGRAEVRGSGEARRLHQHGAECRSRCRRPAGRREIDDAVRIAGDREGNAVAPRRRQSLGSAASDHHAAILRGLGAAAREYGSRRSGRAGGKIAGARPRTDRLFDPSAVHGICRRRSPQAIVGDAGDVNCESRIT